MVELYNHFRSRGGSFESHERHCVRYFDSAALLSHSKKDPLERHQAVLLYSRPFVARHTSDYRLL